LPKHPDVECKKRKNTQAKKNGSHSQTGDIDGGMHYGEGDEEAVKESSENFVAMVPVSKLRQS
jgi:hypothetical protein